MKSTINIVTAVVLSMLALLAARAAEPQYPSRPVRVVVPFAPAGPTDFVARVLAQKMSEAWGQQFVVDNRAGAGGNIGMGIAANSSPDGYTMIFVSSSLVANPGLYKKIPYDPNRSFAPVTKVVASPHAFFTHPSDPAKSIGELIDAVRKNPRKYSLATPGLGTTPDLSGHLLKLDAKLDLVLVPYAGGGPSLAAVLGNQVPIGCQAIPPVTPHFKAGRLRALALTDDKRSPVLPDVPTMAEAGFRGHEADTMTALLLPAGTQKPIVDKLYNEVVRIMALPDVKERMAEQGFNVILNTPDAFAAQIKEEVARWGKVIRDAKIEVQ